MAANDDNKSEPLNALQRMHRATELFRQHDPNVTAALVEAFLTIASAPDSTLTQKDVATRLGVQEATMSQIILRLGTGKPTAPRNGKALGLVMREGDPLDGRANRLKLTAQGRNLATAMTNAIATRGR